MTEWWMWIGFITFVIIMLAIDMFLLGGKRSHIVSTRESISWIIVWIALAFAFNGLLWWYLLQTTTSEIANTKALEFFTGYIIEKSLSMDNMFVFLMIFNYFAVPLEYQRRVLMFGVLSAIVLRFIMIISGVWLVEKFNWILIIFGLFLVFTGIKMFIFANHKPDIAHNPLLIWMKKHLNVTHTFNKENFFVIQNNKLFVTPLFLVLVLIEISDVIFAVDSIPAIFAITKDPFIVFTSNIFAILGLRSLYFLLANMNERFFLIKYGLAFILTFVGVKMLIVRWVKIPIGIALAVILCTLIISVLLSVIIERQRVQTKKSDQKP